MSGGYRPATDEDARLAALRRYSIMFRDDEQAFEHVTQAVQASLSVPMSAVSMVELDRQWFRCRRGFDVEGTARAISFCNLAVAGGAPVAVEDAAAHPDFAGHPMVIGPPFVRAYLGAPLETPDGLAIGTLCAFDTRPRRFEPGHLEVMASLARLVVSEMELRQAASVDPLTGALLRRAFLHRADRVVAGERGAPASLAILDIDRLRSVNEAYGHAVGDEVLRGFVRHVSAWMRRGDSVGRLAGEEFALLMPGTSSIEALERMEKLRSVIETMGIDAPVNVGITTSIGLAPLAAEIRSTSAWLHVADRALYEAKVFGRNKTVIGDPDATLAAMATSGDRRRVRDLPTESEVLSPLTVMRWVNNLH